MPSAATTIATVSSRMARRAGRYVSVSTPRSVRMKRYAPTPETTAPTATSAMPGRSRPGRPGSAERETIHEEADGDDAQRGPLPGEQGALVREVIAHRGLARAAGGLTRAGGGLLGCAVGPCHEAIIPRAALPIGRVRAPPRPLRKAVDGAGGSARPLTSE